MQGLILSYDYIGKGACVVCMGLVSVVLVYPLLGGRALAPCRVSAPAGHGHSIREQGEKCIIF